MTAKQRKVYDKAVAALAKLEVLLRRSPNTEDNRAIAANVARTRMLLEILR